MFSKQIYQQRREILSKSVSGGGVALFLGNDEMPMNYAANTYHFRQDSTFLYYFGLDLPGLAAVIDLETNQSRIFGDEISLEDIIWMGPQQTLKSRAENVGVQETLPSRQLAEFIRKAIQSGRTVHYLPMYQDRQTNKLIDLLNPDKSAIDAGVSINLIQAVIDQRSVKSEIEIEEIEKAHVTTREMHITAMKMARPGIYEREIAGTIEGIALSSGGNIAFPVILSVRGEILHNHYHHNLLRDGDMLINDSGAESQMHYASDITRTIPVNGRFSDKQKDIYEIVLQAQVETISAIKPDQKNKTLHLQAATIISRGLKDVGLMKGNTEDAVTNGAHALFFPHGLGHMLGLDVHDMENLGEDHVGYNGETKRSDQFGLAYLRLGKNLKTGYVLTIEPGIYFIPELIKKWKGENKFTEYINYDRLESYHNFGGIRIEDNIVVTETGQRIIGKPIPKTVPEVEKMCQE